ncbi:hypothetical protein BRADI_1g57129v3 [Brachypodium distachyon]|uniref:Uncharacterized protein n=1 Tax=Brachypodium distachyon TaxID=15368 RepID=A0A0Q3HD76_BRADI|nr:hypothetical protein BRADI_1g57129v3 [Brachypodium distachyon]
MRAAARRRPAMPMATGALLQSLESRKTRRCPTATMTRPDALAVAEQRRLLDALEARRWPHSAAARRRPPVTAATSATR